MCDLCPCALLQLGEKFGTAVRLLRLNRVLYANDERADAARAVPDRGSAVMRIGMILREGSPLTLLVSPVVVKETSTRICVKPALGGGGWSDVANEIRDLPATVSGGR